MPKRKVFLVRNTWPDMYGGAESYQISLADLLRKHKIEAVVVSSSRKLVDVAKEQGFDSILAPFNRRQNWSGVYNFLLSAYLVWQYKLYRYYCRLFTKEKPDVVNIQSRDDWIAATLAAKKINAKVLWTDHMDFRSWVLQNVDNPVKNFIGKILLKIAKRSDKIIFISNYEYEYFKSLKHTNGLKNLCVIRNGSFDSASRFESIKEDSNSFAYIGRIEDYKGIQELIDGFKVAHKRYPKVKLDIYGTGVDYEKYKKFASENIIFHGFTDEPLKSMKQSKYFILPSYREGLSLSLLDAAMMGRCIIASDVDGNPEVVIDGKTGLLVPAKDGKSLGEAMIRLLSNEKLADKLSKNARAHFEDNFNFEKTFEEKMLRLYEEK